MVSNFQFSNPVLTKLLFEINEQFDSDEIDEIEMQLKTHTKVIRNPEKPEATVLFDVVIGGKEQTQPFWLEAQETARFIWDVDVYTEKDVELLLSQNAPALLLSYIRPIISSVTNASPMGAYDIPFMNFAGQNKRVKEKNKV